jgi:WD40 repeat protein
MAGWTARDLPDTQQIVVVAADPLRPRVIAAAAPSGAHSVIRVFDLEDFETVQTLRLPPVRLWSMAVSPDGTQLVYGDEFGNLGLWDLVAGREVEPVTRRLAGFAISPEGDRVVTVDHLQDAAVWQLSDCRERDRWETTADFASSVAVSHDGGVIATAGGSPTRNSADYIRFWQADNHVKLRESPYFPTHAMSLAFSPDDTLLAASLYDGTTRLYDVASGQERQSLPGCPHTRMDAFSVAFSPDGRTLATGYWIWEKPVRLWDLTTTPASEKRWFTGPAHNVRSVAFSPLGDLLIAASQDETVRLWNATTGKQDDYLPNHAGGALAAATSPDGQWLAVGDGTGQVSLWPLTGKRVVPTHRIRVGPYDEPVLQLQFTPDSRHVLALVDNGTVAIVRLAERPTP